MFEHIQSQLNDTIQITRTNLEKLHERHLKLENLENKNQFLQQASEKFNVASKILKKKLWWTRNKTKVILASIGFGTIATGTALVLL